VRAGLAEAGIEADTFAVPGEPSVDLIRAGTEQARCWGVEAVIGYGGGSALDAAKAIGALAPGGSEPLDHLEVVGRGLPLTNPSLPCVAVPTTAGTGSEVTRNAVLSHNGVKASLRSRYMVPLLAIVDPDLLVGLTAPTIAAGGSDALSQVIEPYLSARSNPFTDALAREGIRRSGRSLVAAVTEGLHDPGRREDLAVTSLFGGLCLANAGLGAVHGFAGALGARYEAPHGAVCGALLADVVAVNLAAARRRGVETVVSRTAEIAALLTGDPQAEPDDAVTRLREIRVALAIAPLSAYGVLDEHVPELLAQARQASSMKANPIELSDEELGTILRQAL
jgi:alcohol dehydrogenase class IV